MPEQAQQSEKKRAFDTFEVVVEQTTLITPRNKHIRFKLPADKPFHFHAGQFVQIFIPLPDKIKRTSYSVASSPQNSEYFELCVTLVDGGVSSTFLHNLKVGDKLQAMGPLGKFTLPVLQRDPVFIATGSGIAPFRSMINDLIFNKTAHTIYLLFGNRFDGDIIYQKEWETLRDKNKNFKPYFTLSRPTDQWKGPKGYVQDHIELFVPDPKSNDFFICGLSNMINGVQEKLLSLGVPKEQIHYERYD